MKLANLDKLANPAFVVRWQSGTYVPLTGGFDLYVEALIAGLQYEGCGAGERAVGELGTESSAA